MTEIAPGQARINGANIVLLTVDSNGQPLADEDMQKICLHEIGHALGLNGHSTINRDVMFFSRSPTVSPAPTQRDSATICKLYGAYTPAADPAGHWTAKENEPPA